ncbi:MAG: DUF2029 domain-containing protein [Methylobacterium sp.]|uniref:glycosyltransferase family 87 protein n=1 Tax=Methylobacterium sp. TaxID=409 RepID=UPI0025EBD78D|nr:glycosyltransferase family 87 protein [Methylobacterium sp.]MBX9934336.1 DUF2029 domain-containing protein [Methylobacterium sp.]
MIGTLLTSTLVQRVLLLLLPISVVHSAVRFAWLSDQPGRSLTDFDAFYIAGHMAWRGEIADAYRSAALFQAQRSFSGGESFLPWTYPPPFNLVVALLACLPHWLAYLIFTALTLAAFLFILRRIAGETFSIVLLAIYPAILVTIGCGQNGFLTGALIGLCVLGLMQGSSAAGVPLGLMVIKPHLAVAFALHVVATQRWGCFVLSGSTAILGCVLATIAFGAPVWTAFLGGVEEAKMFLFSGYYPLFRMISVYAALRSIDIAPQIAMAAQVLVACSALGCTLIVIGRRLSTTRILGFTALASLLISPYAYDYDLPIYGIALALLMPDFLRSATSRQQVALMILSLVTSGLGLLTTRALDLSEEGQPLDAGLSAGFGAAIPSAAGVTLLISAVLLWKVLGQKSIRGHETVVPRTAEDSYATALTPKSRVA